MKSRVIDITGQRFGRLKVVKQMPPMSSERGVSWECSCDCGATVRIRSRALRDGTTNSCGCLQREVAKQTSSALFRTHGLTETPEYATWQRIKHRCYNPAATGFEYYGGRGIRVCSRWLESFENFYSDMGTRPHHGKHSIERIDNNGDYEPANCRWATFKEQSNNRRCNVVLEHSGIRLTLSQWSRKLGLRESTLHKRIKSGWTVDRIITQPLRGTTP